MDLVAVSERMDRKESSMEKYLAQGGSLGVSSGHLVLFELDSFLWVFALSESIHHKVVLRVALAVHEAKALLSGHPYHKPTFGRGSHTTDCSALALRSQVARKIIRPGRKEQRSDYSAERTRPVITLRNLWVGLSVLIPRRVSQP